jgi:hypothetical protein
MASTSVTHFRFATTSEKGNRSVGGAVVTANDERGVR